MKPGLYVATVRGVEEVQVWGPNERGDYATLDPVGIGHLKTRHIPRDVTDARPLVVLDPESGDDRHRFRAVFYEVTGNNVTPRQAAAILDALAAPTPAEPMGLGAVVRDRGVEWVRNPAIPHTRGPWVSVDGRWFTWSDLESPEVLSEGWSE